MNNVLEFLKHIVCSTTFLTVISGVLVFVIGQLFNEYFLKPIQDYKNLRAKISYSLTLYANLYMNPVELKKATQEYSDASLEIRKLAASVAAMIELKPFGNIFIPKKSDLEKASEALIGISNGFIVNDTFETTKHNDLNRNIIYKALKIKSHNKKSKRNK